MARPRVVVPGYPHHVITRGNNRRRLFSSFADYQFFIACVARAKRLSGCLIHAIALMVNHVHALVTPPTPDALPRFVRSFSQRYAQVRNKKRGATGKLFEQRYISVLIDDEVGMARATAYVDLNAFRASLVADPLGHPWSTFALHANRPELSRIPRAIWTPSGWYLGLGSTPNARAAAYCELAIELATAARATAIADRIDRIGQAAASRRRLERPDGSSAR